MTTQDARTPFTADDARTLIAIAESAPQQNLRSAMQSVELLKRFWAWYGEQTAPKVPAVVDPAVDPVPELLPDA